MTIKDAQSEEALGPSSPTYLTGPTCAIVSISGFFAKHVQANEFRTSRNLGDHLKMVSLQRVLKLHTGWVSPEPLQPVLHLL